ncbi:hypothetical protein ACDW_00350 [Acidovorax sp. DW039]|nr:hypothetical protein ACDW_00350 [Acidovorax sp. DW039]
MKQRPRIYYSDTQKALMWERWKQGWTLHEIGKLFDRAHSSIYRIIAETGGFRPPERSRAAITLTLAEREEISRAMVSGDSIRSIATRLGRSPSTISREIKRNGDCDGYRATRLTLRSHPLTLQRARLRRYATATKLAKVPNSVPIRCCGTVALRQSLPTAMGVLFISLEDETGAEQVIVWAIVRDEYRDVFGRSSCLFVMSAGSAEATRAISQRAAILAI